MIKYIVIILFSFVLNEEIDSLNSLNESNDAWKMNLFKVGGGMLPLGQLENNQPIKAFVLFGMKVYWLKEFQHLNKGESIKRRNRSFWWLFFLNFYEIIDAYVDSQMGNFPEKTEEDLIKEE